MKTRMVFKLDIIRFFVEQDTEQKGFDKMREKTLTLFCANVNIISK